MALGILGGWLLAVFHNWIDRERHKPAPAPRRSFSVEPALKPWIVGDEGRTRPAWKLRIFADGVEIDPNVVNDEFLDREDAEEAGRDFVALGSWEDG